MFGFLKHFFKLQFLLILVAIFVGIYYKQIVQWILSYDVQTATAFTEINDEQFSTEPVMLFTRQQLTKYNGEDGSPIYLALLGMVFDVTKGIKHYGPGCSYNFFVGRDASVSFITGEFEHYNEEEADNIINLAKKDLLSLDNWKRFYEKEYKFKGKLIGRFYNTNGAPTAYHYKYLELLEQAKAEKAQSEHLRVLYPDCNIEWSAETGSHVWCTTTSGGKEREWQGHPRKLFEVGDSSFRCVCVRKEDLDTTQVMLNEYEGCAKLAHECYYKVD